MILCILWKDNWIISCCLFMVWDVEISFSDWLPLKSRKPKLLCYLYSSLENKWYYWEAERIENSEIRTWIDDCTFHVNIHYYSRTCYNNHCTNHYIWRRQVLTLGISICDSQRNVSVEILNPLLIFQFVTIKH